jgi:hypothetical protein
MSKGVKEKIISANHSEIKFDELSHVYTIKGVALPSVTQVMKRLSEEYYTDINPRVIENAGKRGTKVHQAIELYETMGIYDYEVKDYVLQYLRVKSAYKFTPIKQELMLTNGVYCGTVDMIATMNDKLVLIDLKATSKINEILVEVQLAGYKQLLLDNDINVEDCYVLHLTNKSGKLKKIIPNDNLWRELLNEVYRNI